MLVGIALAFVPIGCGEKGDPLKDITLKDGTRCIIWNNSSITCDWTGGRQKQSYTPIIPETEEVGYSWILLSTTRR